VSKIVEWYIDFFEFPCTCKFGELVTWHLVGKRGVMADAWEGGGLGFNPRWKD
jgi:hypothetical protein